MKSIKICAYGMMAALLSTGIVSCTKTFDEKIVPNKDFTNSTVTQLYMATVGAVRNYIYMDGKPVNGSALTIGSIFPTTGYGFNVPAGLRAFLIKDTLSTTTQPQQVFAENMTVGKNYTMFSYDTVTSPKHLTVPTVITVPADNSARIRFANFAYSKNMLPGVDIFSVKKQANVFTNIETTKVTDFITYPSAINDTFYVRSTGTTTNLTTITPPTPAPGNVVANVLVAFTPTPKRSYTIVFRGSYVTTLTNSTAVRTLSVFANY